MTTSVLSVPGEESKYCAVPDMKASNNAVLKTTLLQLNEPVLASSDHAWLFGASGLPGVATRTLPRPPSTFITNPVMYELLGCSRNSYAAAASSAVPNRPNGITAGQVVTRLSRERGMRTRALTMLGR